MIDRRTLLTTLATFALMFGLAARVDAASMFDDVTSTAFGRSTDGDDEAAGGWSNKVVLADIDGDGLPDILIANGGNYEDPGSPEMSAAWTNNGDGTFTDVSAAVFGAPGLTRAIRAFDADGDGDLDIFVAGAWQTPSRLLINDGSGHFSDESAARLPSDNVELGDAQIGDIDGDGALDIVCADWGDGDPFQVRGRARVLMNDGTGHFSDESDARLPTSETGMAWQLALIDADDDLDLDVVISCKACLDGGIYLENQGDGTFLDRSGLLPGGGNNYQYEVGDVDGDGDLDLFTVNDGDNLTERLLINDLNNTGTFIDASDQIDAAANPENADDNIAVFADVDGDGDLDVVIGSLSDADRILLNDGAGHFTAASEDAVDGADTPGTLGLALGDLDGDGKLDLVMVQGEEAFGDHVYRGVDSAQDERAPFVAVPRQRLAADGTSDGFVYARIHDDALPVAKFQFSDVSFDVDGARVPAVWLGEQLWRAPVSAPAAGTSVQVKSCATDVAGNTACSQALTISTPAVTKPPSGDPGDGTHAHAHGPPSGCGALASWSSSSSSLASAPFALLLVALACTRRRTRRASISLSSTSPTSRSMGAP